MPEVYCTPCKINHRVTTGEMERIVYTLAAGWADADIADPIEDVRQPGGFPAQVCLEDAGTMSWDSESYAEHVEQAVECRKALARGEEVAG